jgi:beta-glucosidase
MVIIKIMSKNSIIVILILALPVRAFGISGDDKPMDIFITNLMLRMTLDQKIGQLNLMSVPSFVSGNVHDDDGTNSRLVHEGHLGAMYGSFDVNILREMQKIAVEESPNGIPLIFGYDVIHGLHTVQPIPLAQSTSWNPALVEAGARAAANEATASGINWIYSPMIDICRDARWGRIAESMGEDPYLSGEYAKAYVRGYQGNDLSADSTVLSCVKHYALYGAAESGRDYNSVFLSRQEAMNGYMPPYREAVKAGAASFMTSFNEFEGIPATINEYLLKDILRNEWGFKGFVVTDYNAIPECVDHGLGNIEHVTALALKAGVDMDLNGGSMMAYLEKLVKTGKVNIAEVDQACRRILEAKYRLGLFDDPYRYLDINRYNSQIRASLMQSQVRQMAHECQVLLKNEGSTLPLSKNMSIALIGPLADDSRNMQGCWAFSRYADEFISFRQGLSEAGATVEVAEGCWLMEDADLETMLVNSYLGSYVPGQDIKKVHSRTLEEMIAEAVGLAQRNDVVIAALGEINNMNGEGASRSDISLGRPQLELLKALKATGKSVIVLLTTGRPLAIEDAEPYADAILCTWSLGDQAGRAVADVVFGDVNPSGRLTTSWPRTVGQCPIYYNHKSTGRPHSDGKLYDRSRSSFMDVTSGPLYPFGHGLSYTTFDYSEVKLSSSTMYYDSSVTASVMVTNSGTREGKEVVQLYIHDIYASSSRPVMELKGFQKISLKPGEIREVKFTLTCDDLKFYNHELQYVAEPGDFEIMIGHNSQNFNKLNLTLKNN